jgi:hypothetical protein
MNSAVRLSIRGRVSGKSGTPIVFSINRRCLSIAVANILPNGQNLEVLIRKAHVLLNEELHPVGCYTAFHYKEARVVLNGFKAFIEKNSAELPVLAFDILERLVQEAALANQKDQIRYVCNPKFIYPLMNLWKRAAKSRQNVDSPVKLLQRLQSMKKVLPEFQYDILIVSIILDVTLSRVARSKAPLVAEKMLKFVEEEASTRSDSSMRPNIYIYSQLLQAYAVSNLPQAAERMEDIVQKMRKEGISPTHIVYNILLRFWAGKGDTDQIDRILKTMKLNGLAHPTATGMAQVIYGQSLGMKPRKAEETLQKMIELYPTSPLVGECVQQILMAYRRIIGADNKKLWAVKCAERLFEQRMKNKELMNREEVEKLKGTMLDIHVRAGKDEKIVELINGSDRTAVQMAILTKSFGKDPVRDTQVLEVLLRDAHKSLSFDMFNDILDAWAESTRPIAMEEAFKVFNLMENHPTSKELNIKATTRSFNALLKCLSKSSEYDVARKADDLLDDMHRRYQAGDMSAKPDETSYGYAIKACLNVGDADRAIRFVQKMEKTTSVSLETYKSILRQWSTVPSFATPKHCQDLVFRMKKLSKRNRSIQPDMECYRLVISACVESNAVTSARRLWLVRHVVQTEGLEFDSNDYFLMIRYYSQSQNLRYMERAEVLLNEIIQCYREDCQVDARHFVPLMRAYVKLADAKAVQRIFELRVKSYIAGNARVKPIPQNFHTVVQAGVISGDLKMATSFILNMQHLADTKILPEEPDIDTYNVLIAAWKLSNLSEKKEQIIKLQRVVDRIYARNNDDIKVEDSAF